MYGWSGGSTRAWRRVRARKLARSPQCEGCSRRGRLELAEQVHHIVPLATGGHRFDETNLESLCQSCHEAVHGARRRGCDVHGFPLE